MEKKGKDWSDLKIGDVVTCTNLSENTDWWEERLTIGETYIIEDIESRIPNKICVKLKSKWYSHLEFVPYEFFEADIKFERNVKLEKLLNDSKNVQ
jgi:hypothetical protein